jgi:hypothetical protein
LALPGGLFLQLLIFPHVLGMLVLGRKGGTRAGHTRLLGDKGRPPWAREQKSKDGNHRKSRAVREGILRGAEGGK